MRKISILAVLLSFVSTTAFAVELGFMGGMNYSGASTNTTSTTIENKASFAAGVLASEHFIESMPELSIEGGLFYASRAWEFSGIDVGAGYLEVPVTAQYWFIPQLSAGAGGYFGYGMGDVSVGTATASFTDSSMKRADYGLLGNLAFKQSIAENMSLLASARYMFGLANMSDVASVTNNYRNMQFMAGVGYTF